MAGGTGLLTGLGSTGAVGKFKWVSGTREGVCVDFWKARILSCIVGEVG